MAMYIDTVTPSLNSLTESVGGLQKLRDATIAQRIEKAKLLRDMEENEAAEKELWGAKNYGLSSLFAKRPQGWTLDDPFAGQPQDMVEKKGLQQLQESPELYGGVNATQGKILAEMEKLYGGKTPQYYNQLQVMGLEAGGIDPNKALTVALNKSLSPEYSGIAAMNYPNVKAQTEAYKALQADQKLQDKEIAAKNAPLIKANAQAEAYNKLADIENAKREAYNKNLPSGKLVGNEVDQQQSLIKSTLSAVKAGGGMDAYMRYLTTHKAIDDHYGHNSKPLPPEYFGLGGKGEGGSEKRHEAYVRGLDGKKIIPLKLTDAEFNDPAIRGKILSKYKKTLELHGIGDVSQIDLQFGAGDSKNVDPEEALKIKMMKDAMTKQAAKESAGLFTFKQSSQAKEYNDKLDKAGDTTTPRMDPETYHAVDYKDWVKRNVASGGYKHLNKFQK